MKKIIAYLLGIFILFFLFRIGYGYSAYPDNEEIDSHSLHTNFSDDSRGFRNIASSKYEYKKGSNQNNNSQIVSVDQKYEKTANMGCKSANFDEDEKSIRKTIADNNSIIQFQQKSGNKGYRKLHLQIGVQPDLFDTFIDIVKSNQKVVSFNVTKKDKTNEYRELNSKIETLKTTRASLVELKSKGGKIEEFINLENRILDIDEQLQQLGVMMGSFDSENEFCTINISLQEGKIRKITFYQRVKVALEWTIKYYLLFIILLGAVITSSYVLVLLLDKLKVFIPKVKDRIE